jgi:hypothetical protein
MEGIARKLFAVVAVAAIAVAMLAVPATATPPDETGEHKIMICHVTNSAKNPYVVIEVDVAAFDGEGKNDHMHHVNKDGLTDVPFVDNECQFDPPTDPEDPPTDPDDPPTNF